MLGPIGERIAVGVKSMFSMMSTAVNGLSGNLGATVGAKETLEAAKELDALLNGGAIGEDANELEELRLAAGKVASAYSERSPTGSFRR